MKKYLAIMSILALTGVQAGWANILGIGEISTDGSMEISGQQASNETDGNDTAKDTRGATATRIRIGLNAELGEGVKARVEALRNSQSGGAVVQYGDSAVGGDTVAAEEGAISFENAYIDLENFLQLDSFRLGRQYGGRTGDLLVYYGPVDDDSLTVTALDGLSVSKKFGKITAMFGTGKVAEDDAVANTDAGDVTGDTNVSWITIGSDEIVPNLKVPLELGFYSGTANLGPTIADNNNLTILDLRASTMLMDDKVALGLEFAQNGGQKNGTGPGGSATNYKGTALLLNASYEAKEEGWGAHFGYATASGDDPSGSNPTADDDAFHDFRTIGWAVSDYRYGEIMSNSNTAAAATALIGAGLDTGALGTGINVMNIGGKYKLPVWDGKVWAMADYYTASVNETAAGIDDGVGSEIDLALKYMHSDSVTAKIGYATFTPEKGLLNAYAGSANLPDDAVTKLFAKLMVKWGGERAY
jgi:hypothetical protein